MAEKKFMDFKPYSTYRNCFINDDAKAWIEKEESFISHYMPYSRLEEWINQSVMTFVSPDKWDDPFERIYLRTHFENLFGQKEYVPASIACLCFTKYSFKNSVAFWKVFKNKEQMQLVRVVFSFKKMIAQIIESIEKQKVRANVYIAAVDYSLQQENIKDKQSFIKHIMRRSCCKKTEAESLYIKMLSFKRKAYAFEEEIRIILVPHQKIEFDENQCFVIKGLDYKTIIKNIWLEPIRLPSGWISEDSIKERLPKFKKKIYQSPLYDEQKKCMKIDLDQLKIKGK